MTFLVQWQADVDARLKYGVDLARAGGYLSQKPNPEETIILIQGWGKGSGKTNTLRTYICMQECQFMFFFFFFLLE
jgi:hypothetical protein